MRLPTPASRRWSMSRAFSATALPAERAAELGRGDAQGVGAEGGLVGVELDAAEQARVAHHQTAAVGEATR